MYDEIEERLYFACEGTVLQYFDDSVALSFFDVIIRVVGVAHMIL